MTTTTSANPMLMMEHAENTLGVPPLVDPGVPLDFCQAVQSYGASIGAEGEVGARLRLLQATLADLRNLGVMSRFAVLGHPHSFARVVDEMYCSMTGTSTIAASHSADTTTLPDQVDAYGDPCGDYLRDLSVMFCPHQPAPVARLVP